MRRAAHRSTGRSRLVEPGDEELRRKLAVGIREDFGDLLPVGSVGMQIEPHADPVVSAESWDEEALRIFRDEFIAGTGRCGGPERDMSLVEPMLFGVDELGRTTAGARTRSPRRGSALRSPQAVPCTAVAPRRAGPPSRLTHMHRRTVRFTVD